MKYFRMSYEECVFRRSYLNILLLNRSIPNFNANVHENGNSALNSTKTVKKADYKHPNDFFMQFM